ncbi:putative porin [Tamlana fucoidanivorans]|uniref:Porin n=2 Tax=Allotamlana fucoidanivorans TaxID=2583814 RepID=A0A5C4SGF2_9FLAO|nr:hypothetical protein FGF67_14015 [Tamlana fucoidanivorans]
MVEAQNEPATQNTQEQNTVAPSDSLLLPGNPPKQKPSKDKGKPLANIQDYQIISFKNDTTFVDTTLTIQKDYKMNYLRRDNFGLIPFANLGQTYNQLTYNFENTSLMPKIGARARHFNYMEVEDINYYRMPTPYTELFYRSAFEQGQLLDAFFSANLSPQFNFSIAYKGLRSLGKYQHILTSTGNFRVTGNYQSKNRRYNARGHIVTQDLMNQENGGLTEDSVENFESGDEEFFDRSILEVNFEDAESILLGKRYHLDHSFNIVKPNDSVSKNRLSLGHVFTYKTKYFQYDQQSAQTAMFGDAFKTRDLTDKVVLKNMYNEANLNYSNNVIGDLHFNINNNSYNYGYNRLVSLNGQLITNRLIGDVVAIGGKYHKQHGGVAVTGEGGLNLSGDFKGNYIKGTAGFKLKTIFEVEASINHSSKAPNYNAQLYQSNYLSYNWQNRFKNIETQQLGFKLASKKIADISVDFSTIDNYVYFMKSESTGQVAPFQSTNTINYLRVRLDKEFKVGKFALNNTIEYQNVTDKDSVLNVPEFNTRNTLYFSSHVFKKALYLQTGFTFNYFTEFFMNAYNPIMAEFYVQKERKFGGFPRLDFFLNAQIRRTRIYFKAEHFNSSVTGYNYYSAPTYPYRDFIVRFGLVWNFFH